MNTTSKPRIAVLTIGQTPRPDLVASLGPLPDVATISVYGALDNMPPEAIESLCRVNPPSPELGYPLVTTIRPAERIVVEEVALGPLLQETIDHIEQASEESAADPAVLHLLMCAGPFDSLRSQLPLVRPFALGVNVLRSFGVPPLAVVVPNDSQREPAKRKWEAAGFTAQIWSLDDCAAGQQVDEWVLDMYNVARRSSLPVPACVVFDYVGFTGHVLDSARTNIDIPVMDLGVLAVQTVTALVERCSHARSGN